MHKLLDNHDKNSLFCLRYFSEKKSLSKITIQDMLNDLQWERRKLLKILADLSETSKQNNWETYLTFKYVNNELHIELSDAFSLDFFLAYYLKNNVLFQFLIELFNDDFIDLQKFTEERFLAKGTFYRKMKRLKILLADFNLHIDLTKKERIIGEEHQIRYFFHCLFTEGYHFSLAFAHKVEHAPINAVLAFIKKIHPELPYSFSLKLRSYLAVTLTRITQGFYVPLQEDYPHAFSTTVATDILTQIQTLLLTNLSPKQLRAETNFFYMSLLANNTYPLDYIKREKLPVQLFLEHVSQQTKRFINLYARFFKQPLAATEYFYLLINLTAIDTHTRLFKGSTNHFRMDFNVSLLKKNYPLLYSMCDNFYNFLQKENSRTLSDTMKINYFFLLRELIDTTERSVNICLLSKVNSLQYATLKKKIQRLSQVDLSFINHPSAEVDFYIADFKLSALEDAYPDAVFHYWPSLPDEAEQFRLVQRLNQLYRQPTQRPRAKKTTT
ncbi:helix-turn-helix domain-containing protein [Brochothrix campestris]|uniref:Mga helix-turn-helix domain-containing protein n=1 Tax=Brochothrix campestris FSL F6-1037 TaxID=1265861 RepID=W7CSA0_9LIST|nr:helix-turn-helix domain-containing protein [Brochothrix campestris]EUJ39560.1 mga helix-turn-helix domain-containing protein [Brochothrix campestris FSL F6-1037]